MLLCHSCSPLLANFQLGNPFYQQIRGIPHTHWAILLLFLLISGLQLQFLLSISARHSVYISIEGCTTSAALTHALPAATCYGVRLCLHVCVCGLARGFAYLTCLNTIKCLAQKTNDKRDRMEGWAHRVRTLQCSNHAPSACNAGVGAVPEQSCQLCAKP